MYVCDPEPAAAHVLAARHPDAPNLHDLKTLTWADIPVDVLTAGYPCQPFSGAGKRAGTDDPRHLWPWIAQGIAQSRPSRVFLENVRGHLSLGWDTVLSDLHDLGYDVRWTLLRAADVGAAHNRARLFAVAADRAVHRWARPTAWPVARIADGTLNAPHDGLFGAHPLPLAENGHVPMWPAGLMIDGVVWEQDALLGTAQYEMLPTPQAHDAVGGKTPGQVAAMRERTGAGVANLNEVAVNELEPLFRTPTAQLAVNGGSQHPDQRKDGGHGPTLADEIEHPLPTPSVADTMGGHERRGGDRSEELLLLGVASAYARGDLLPTPRASDTNGVGEHGAGGLDLRTAVEMLPTPTARDWKDGTYCPNVKENALRGRVVWSLLPTPHATDGEKGGPNQRGSSGDLMLPCAVMPANLLPTPRSLDATGVRGQTTNRSADANAKAGLSLTDVAEHLLLTPAVNDMWKAYTPEEWDAWCDKQRAAHGNGNGHDPSLEIEAARMAVGARWGRYAAAVTRCEALTRPAPDPTLPSGKGGAHRLSPLFVEFLMMLPAGWVTDPELWTHLSASAARNVQLKLLGNGCVTAQAAAAWRHLTSGLVTTTQMTALGA